MARPPEGDQLSTIRSTILGAVTTKPPVFVDETRTEKVAKLEDYMLKSAQRRAEIEESLFLLKEMYAVLYEEWENIRHWEGEGGRKKPTVASINEAKRLLRPELHGSLSEVKRLIGHCERIVERFEHEARYVISRTYTMISGGSA